MISLTCTNCRTRLEIDDAFAGGVCRCQYCGTIQTVPSSLKRASHVAPAPTSAAPAAGLKSLYRRSARERSAAAPAATEPSTTAAAPQVSARTRAAAPASSRPRGLPPLRIALGVILLLGLALAAWWLLR